MVKSFNVYIEDAVRIIDIDQRYQEAESFYLRLFKLLYGYKELINLNLEKKNFPGIDLYESKLNLGIQITALTSKSVSDVSTKVTNTIQRFLASNEYEKYPTNKFVIFFTKDSKYIREYKRKTDLKELENKHKIKIKVRTSSSLCEKYDSIISTSRRNYLHEFIRAEMECDFKGTYALNYISIIENEFQNSSLFYTEKEILLKEKITLQISNSSDELLILGSPCSGKTEFAKSLSHGINSVHRIYYLDFFISDTTLETDGLMEDLFQLSFNHSILIIDDAHLNAELLKRIRTKLISFPWIKPIYIARPTNEIRSLLAAIPKFYIDNKANQAQKVLGIVRKWTSKQSKSGDWQLGDIEAMTDKYRNNLVKLSLALSHWNDKGANIKFSDLEESEILDNFFDNQNLKDFQTNALFISAYLGKHDIPTRIYRSGRTEIRDLENIGLLQRIRKSEYYRYEHREIAKAIFQSCSIRNSFDDIDIENWLTIYIDDQPNISNLNVTQLLIGLYKCRSEHLAFILNFDKIKSEIINVQTNNTLKGTRNPLVQIVSSNLNSIAEENLSAYRNFLKSKLEKSPLLIYNSIDYEIYQSLKSDKELSEQIDLYVKKNNSPENSRQKRITELTKSISKKKFAEGTVHRILNTYDFPTWYLKVMELHELSQLSMVLSELNTSSQSRMLLNGILSILKFDKFLKNNRGLTCDKIGIALREFQSIDDTIGTGIAHQLWEEPIIRRRFDNSIKNSNLSSCLKALSDIRYINRPYSIQLLTELISEGLILKYINREESLGSIILRVQELCKFDRFIDTIYPLLYSYFNSKRFHSLLQDCNKSETLRLIKLLLNNPKYDLKNGITEETENLINDKLSEFKSTYSDISTKKIEEFIRNNKFTKLEHYLTSIRRINKNQATTSFQKVDPTILFNAAIKGPLAAYQIAEQLFKFRTWLFLNRENNCDSLIETVFNKYLDYQVHQNSRFKQLPFEKFLSTFSYGLKINSDSTKKHLEGILLYKLSKLHTGSNSLSIIFQMLRRITDLEESYIEPVKKYLNNNLNNFVTDINDQDLTKSIPGIIELSKSQMNYEALELLELSKEVLLRKIKLKSNQVTSIESIVRGLTVVDHSIENKISNEIIASL